MNTQVCFKTQMVNDHGQGLFDQDVDQCLALVQTVLNLGFITGGWCYIS